MNSSSEIHQPLSSLHHISPHILNKTSASFSSNHIPRNSIKQQPKHLTKVIFSPPTTNSFWGNIAGITGKGTIIRLRKTTKFTQDTKTLTDLSFNLKTFLPFDFKYAIYRFQYLKNLSVLDLQITKEKHLTFPSNMKILYHAFANLKNLTHLSLEFPQFSEVPLQLIDSICFALRRLPSFAHLSLKFAHESNLDDLMVKRLASHLKKLSQLKSIAFDFNRCIGITNIGLQPLSETFENLPLLSNVTLRLQDSKGCSAATISNIFSGLSTCKSLKRLDLFLKPGSDCDPNSVEPGLNMLNPLSLREIVLKLDPVISGFGVNQLSHALARFSSLTTLSIDFSYGYYISDEGLSQFSSALQTLTSLSTFSLSNLHGCNSSQLIEFISQGFGPLIQLKNLSLDFHMCKDQKSTSIKTLSSNLQNLKLLKQLNLRLDSCKFMNDADLCFLSEALGELKDLTNLVMHLTNIRKEENPGLKSLLLSFSNLKKLHHITLKLASNSTNDEILKVIVSSLQSLPALDSLNLAIPSTEELSYDEGLGVLCDSLRNLASLKNIALEVKKTKEAVEKIEKLEKVKSVTMTWN